MRFSYCSQVLKNYLEYDKLVNKFGHSFNESVLVKRVSIIFTLANFSLAVSVKRFPSSHDHQYLEQAIASFVNVVSVVCILNLNLLISMLYQRFRHLNNVIVPKASLLKKNITGKGININDLRCLYGYLYDSFAILQNAHSIFFIVLLFNSLIIHIFVLSVSVILISYNQWSPRSLTFIIHSTLRVLCVCFVCHQTADEVSIYDLRKLFFIFYCIYMSCFFCFFFFKGNNLNQRVSEELMAVASDTFDPVSNIKNIQ